MPAALHTIALLISLFVQSDSTPLAGAWLLFFLAGCVALIYNNKVSTGGMARYTALAWLIMLGLSTFIIVPVVNGANDMWILAAMPLLALSLRKEHLKPYFWCFGSVVFLYACGLILQKCLNMHYTIDYDGRIGWPLIDPNNAACVVNLALVPCVWLALFKDLRWWLVFAVFAAAMYATGSKAGIGAAGISIIVFLACRYGADFLLFIMAIGMIFWGAIFIFRPEIILTVWQALGERFPIWQAAWQIWQTHPIRGTGLGTFGKYRIQVGDLLYIPPTYVHNDVFQFAVEMGTPAALVFLALVFAVVRSTRSANLAPACALLAVFIQSMFEFQFFLQSISILSGLALASHIILTEKPKKGIMR